MKKYNQIISKIIIGFITSLIAILMVVPNVLFAQENPYVYMEDNNLYHECGEYYPVTVNYGVMVVVDNGEVVPHVSPLFQYCIKIDPPNNCFPWFTCGGTVEDRHAELREQFEKIVQLGFNTIRLTGLAIRYKKDNNGTGVLYKSAVWDQQSEPCYVEGDEIVIDDETSSEQMGDLLQEVIDIINDINDDDPEPLDLKLIVLAGGHGVEMISDPNEYTYSDYLSYLANRFKDEPVILGYDLYNEPLYFQYKLETMPGKIERAETCLQWYNAIKQNAPAHLVTIGPTNYDVYEWDPKILPVDFVSFHIYSFMKEGDGDPPGYIYGPAFERYKVHLQWMTEAFDLPIYTIGETGFPGINNEYPIPHPKVGTEEQQQSFAEESLKHSKWYGTKGYSWWMYKDVDFIPNQDPDAIQNFFGVVRTDYDNGAEIIKPAGNVFKIYDPSEECVDCSNAPNERYLHPNPDNYTNKAVSGIVTGPNGPLENVLIWGIIRNLSIEDSEHSLAITDANGHYELMTSFNDFWVPQIDYTYPGMERIHKEDWDNGLPLVENNATINDLDPSSIPQKPDLDTYTIETGETEIWETGNPDQVRYLPYKNIIIEDGAELTITANVFLSQNARITVEPGGKLLIDGGKITSSCGQWYGIEVWGNPTAGQNPIDQGWVLMQNDATIENSLHGIVASFLEENPTSGPDDFTPNPFYAGGIIQASNSHFKNNGTAVQLYDYPQSSSSWFVDCEFKVDQAYIGNEEPENYMHINDMKAVSITYCDFINSSLTPHKYTGILCENSTISLKGVCTGGQPCNEWDYGLFQNLEYGIYATVFRSTTFIDVEHTEFNDNYRGMYISGMSNARVVSNKFEINTPYVVDGGYGLYLDHSTAYEVEENNFFHDWHGTVGVGLIVNESGGDPNRIYHNYFYKLDCGMDIQGENKDKSGIGLELKCNQYENTFMDKIITWDEPFVNAYSGIASNQGSSGSTPEDMAGNLFYVPGPSNDDGDDIFNEGNSIVYYVPANYDPLYWNVIPEDITDNVTLEPIGEFIWTFEEGCPPSDNTGGGGIGIGDTKSSMAESELKIDSTENLLSLLIDGGNTEATQTEVDNSIPPETMQVYNDLMNKSPYLSDTVVSTAIEKEDVLPGAMIRDIMVANPKAAKSELLMEKLDNRWDPLPDYMKGQILAGRSVVSIMEETESRLAAFKLEKAKCFNDLTRYYMNDTIDPVGSMDSLMVLLENENSLWAKYSLAFMNGEHGAWGDGLAVLNSISDQFELSDKEATEHSQMLNYYNLLSSLAQEGKSVLQADSSQIATLSSIEESLNGMASVYARNILLALNQMEYEEPIILPDLLKSSEAMDEYKELLGKADEAPGFIKVKPNPAKDYIIIEYELVQEVGSVIEIHDISGNLKYSGNSKNRQDQFTVDARNWKAGIYIVSLKINGELIESIKFSIID